jgi:ribosome-dependent ATPase
MFSFFTLVALSVWGFGVPLKGSFSALTTGALLYVGAATGLGLLISAFTRTQIAAFAATAIVTLLVAVNFCGMTHPVSSLEGAGAVVGRFFPATYFLIISRGAFTKALGWSELGGSLLALALFLPPLTLLSLALLKKQGR